MFVGTTLATADETTVTTTPGSSQSSGTGTDGSTSEESQTDGSGTTGSTAETTTDTTDSSPTTTETSVTTSPTAPSSGTPTTTSGDPTTPTTSPGTPTSVTSAPPSTTPVPTTGTTRPSTGSTSPGTTTSQRPTTSGDPTTPTTATTPPAGSTSPGTTSPGTSTPGTTSPSTTSPSTSTIPTTTTSTTTPAPPADPSSTPVIVTPEGSVGTGDPDYDAAAAESCPAPEPAPEKFTYERARYAGVSLTADQQRTAVMIMAVGKDQKISKRGAQIAIAAALQESSLLPDQVNGPYVGLYQQLYDPTTGLYGDHDRMDAVGATRMFYDQLEALVPGYDKDSRPDWRIAEAVQQTRLGELFDGRKAVAVALIKKFYDQVDAYGSEPVAEPVCDKPVIETSPGASGVPGAFDPGMIISDDVFYNAKAMTEAQIRAFIKTKNAECVGEWCLKNLKVPTKDQAADKYCDAYQGSPDDDAAAVIAKVSVACGINPQVMLVTLQKESGLLDRTSVSGASYAAAYGWHCPDTGPGGSANCDPAYAGFFSQAYGMAKQWSRYVVDAGKYRYQAGDTAEVLWNVVESGCGGAPVHIRNKATASLYNYTPYQPNAAALAAYPGTGDSCSTYGNRNFYFLFGQYFGTAGLIGVTVKGVDVVIPDSPAVPGALVGSVIKAPNAKMAKGIAAGLANLGTPYVWGGGTGGGAADEGCARGGGASNSCQGIVGFDCSGLTGYVLTKAGYAIGDNSWAQRSGGTSVPFSKARAGDIVGWDGHVAIYLGKVNGVEYVLEAPDVGRTVSIRALYGSHDAQLHRYWS